MDSTPGTNASAHPHGDLTNPEVAHEQSDINIRAVLWFVAILLVTSLAIHLSMYGLFKVFAGFEARSDPEVSPLMAPAGQLPPEPRLQTSPWTDLKKFHEIEERHLHTYGWVDEKAGVAHLPIEKAKALLLQRGLPVSSNAADAMEGTHVAASGESSSGRLIPAGGADKSTAQPAATPPQAAQPGPPPAPTPPKGPGGGL
jgi:hypothetical protein